MDIFAGDTAQLRLFPEGGMALEELPTPCLVLDTDRLERNIARFREHWQGGGVRVRPHLKTCRTWPVALQAMESPEGPCCVATMGEAEACAELGAEDIVLAVGIRPGLFERARALLGRGTDLKVLLDSAVMARALAGYAAQTGTVFSVLLEVDCDGHRAGLAPEDPRLAEIADLLAAAGQKVAGILTHAGSAYDVPDPAKLRTLASREMAAAAKAAALLRAHGHACPVVSIGSTPTGLLGSPAEAASRGVTEVRAGVYMFMDLVMEGLGVCTKEDIALTVLTSVIGGFAGDGGLPGRLITDAGWAALSTDRGLASRFASQGYGLVCDLAGTPLPGLRAADLNQEHGMISVNPNLPEQTERAVLGLTPESRLRILPNHACAAAMMHRGYFLARGGRALAFARRFGGW